MDIEEIGTPKSVGMAAEAIIMLTIAVIFDIAGVICTILIIAYGIGEIFSWIIDIIGFAFFGTWLLVRSSVGSLGGKLTETAEPEEEPTGKGEELIGKVVEKRQAIGKATGAIKAMKRKGTVGLLRRGGLRFIIAFVGEIIPIVGILPFWTWFVWSELKS